MADRALVRHVSASFADALRHDSQGPCPDLELARIQHAAYRRALADIGFEVEVLSALDDHPDACFVEDRLVAGWGQGLLTWSRAPSRRGESASIQGAVAQRMPLMVMEGQTSGGRDGGDVSGGLDGGDVIQLGDLLLVGLSERTDRHGVAALEDWTRGQGVTVRALPPSEGLHLKCSATPLGPNTLLCAEDWPHLDALPPRIDVIRIPADEAYAANAVFRGDAVVMAAGYPNAASRVASTGRRVLLVDVSAFKVADGALTCLSVLFRTK
jgi:dimethylargininase